MACVVMTSETSYNVIIAVTRVSQKEHDSLPPVASKSRIIPNTDWILFWFLLSN